MNNVLDLLQLEVHVDEQSCLKEIIPKAKAGSIEDLSILARGFSSLPNPLDHKIHLIFFHHLHSLEVPDSTDGKSTVEKTEDEGRAFWSLWGIARLALVLSKCPPVNGSDPYGEEFIEAWPGVFKWSTFFYSSQIQIPNTVTPSSETETMRAIIRSLIAGAWYTLALSKSTNELMMETPGMVAIAAKLWLLEGDLGVTAELSFDDGIPHGTFLLGSLLGYDDEVGIDNLTAAAEGDTTLIVTRTMYWLKKAINSPHLVSSPLDGGLVVYLMTQISALRPKFRGVFVDHGAITVCIELLIQIASIVNQDTEDSPAVYSIEVIKMVTMSFWFIGSSLEKTSGPSLVTKAINAGLLTAFVECSPIYGAIDDSEYQSTISIPFTKMIPRYLVYCSVVKAMDKMLRKLERTERFLSLRNTKAWEAFDSFALLTGWRLNVAGQVKQIKKYIAFCCNPKCRKMNARNDFRKCAKCQVALYCSRECQAVHWKEFDHKKECRVQEPNKFLESAVEEWKYLENLNICEARRRMPRLRRLAATEHPGVPLTDLAIVIDYHSVPTTSYIDLLSKWKKSHPSMFNAPLMEAPFNMGDGVDIRIIGLIPCAGSSFPHLTRLDVDIWRPDGPMRIETGPSKAGKYFSDWMDEEAEAKRKVYCGL